jgi:hypothetical protein
VVGQLGHDLHGPAVGVDAGPGAPFGDRTRHRDGGGVGGSHRDAETGGYLHEGVVPCVRALTINFRACVGDWAGSLEASTGSIRNCSSWEVTLA